MSEDLHQRGHWRNFFYILLILSSTLLALLALLIPELSNSPEPPIEAGLVAQTSYFAPTTFSFVSDILTEQRRQEAEKAILPVYTPLDTRVARQQLENLHAIMAFISSVRADAYATQGQKLEDLAAIEDIQLSEETSLTILGLTDARWQILQQEAIVVLERMMSSEIRPEGVDAARRRAPALVSLTLPESQADVVAELAAAFVTHNTQFSSSLTQTAQEKARAEVDPVVRSFAAGQTIVRQGQVLSVSDVEALQKMGLAIREPEFPDLTSTGGLALLMVAFVLIYLRREKLALARDTRSITLIAVLFLAFLFGARLSIPGRTIIPYAFPLAAYGLTTAALFGAQPALVTSLPLAILSAYGLPNALDLTLYYIITSLFGVLVMGRGRRMWNFFWAGVAIAGAGSVIILIYRLPLPTTDMIGIATLVSAAFFNGLASASITILLQFALAQFLGAVTPLQLVDLTRPDHPLLRLLLRDAPGTYQHSLQVANLAEQAAERIGADPLLTRVGAMYHDIGKTLNPVFFIENQVPGIVNPHEDLTAEESSKIIIQHVPDGLALGRKYRLPRRVLEFILEHHGSLITHYQYVRAVEAAGANGASVAMDQFRYPGPRPQSRETAILMLADGSEARVRAERPANEDDLRNLIRQVINDRMAKGQLDDTRLTLRDLNMILESFTVTLRGMYHPRVQYPSMDTPEPDEILQAAPPEPAEPLLPADLSIGSNTMPLKK
ncbi:MAG: HDIG domain-containing protein [Anaerolineales bacterium]|nr:HDIG domain-containing protein [Anaerolineales bacterium]